MSDNASSLLNSIDVDNISYLDALSKIASARNKNKITEKEKAILTGQLHAYYIAE